MKNLKLTNLEKMPQKEMEQVKGGIFGMGKKFLRYGKGGVNGACSTICAGSCSTTSSRSSEGLATRNGNSVREGREHL